MRPSARQVLERVLDDGTLVEWGPPVQIPLLPPEASERYLGELARARETAGTAEAVVVGEGLLRGRRVAVIAGEFAFLGGSVGLATARLLTACVARATAEGLPLLASPVSGGTRMQEGTPAFVQMATVTAALAAHRRAGLPYLVWLRSPCFGGVFASWGSLGHLTYAEPGAAVGFLGPRVYEALHGEPFPTGVQTAENLAEHGLLDGVLSIDEVRDAAAAALAVLCAPRTGLVPSLADDREPGVEPAGSAWDDVVATRSPDRPGVREVLADAQVHLLELHGSTRGHRGRGTLLGLARVGAVPCVLVGQDRGAGPVAPADLRVARRGAALAQELGLPLVTVVDTSGGELSPAAEQDGLARQIAACLYDLAGTTVPTLCVLLGQGAGGAALALTTADRVVAARHAWLSPLPPEGASALVHRTTERAAEMAVAQRVGCADLLHDGVVDVVVDERPDAAREPVAFARRLLAAVEHELLALLAAPEDERLARRSTPRGLGARPQP